MSDSAPAYSVGEWLGRRPAVLLLACLTGGILSRDLAALHPWYWLVLASGAAIAGAATINRSIVSTICLAVSVGLLGLCAAQVERFAYPANHLWAYTTNSQRLAQVELKMEETPRVLAGSSGQTRTMPPRQIALARVRAVRTIAGWELCSGQVALSIEQLNAHLASGQVIRVTGMLERPMPPSSPGEFDWGAYYRRQHILAALRVNHADAVEVLEDGGASPISWLRDKSRHLLAMGFAAGRSFDHSLLRALLLGDSDPQLRDVQDQFTRTGTIHYLSVSGLHIAIMGGFVLMLCRLLRRSPRAAIWTAGIFVVVYALVALPSWPGVRSTVMCVAAAAGLLSRRPVDSLNLFALAVAGVLLYQPGDISDGGFQVSFVAVLAMILCSNRFLHWFWSPSVNVPIFGAQRRSTVNRAGRTLARFIVGTFVAGAVAWLASMPLVAYHFGQISYYSVPAGIVLLPMTVLAMLGGAAKVLLTLCWPSMSGHWAVVCVLPTLWMQQIVHAIDRLPGSSVQAGAPPVWKVLAYYALLALVFVSWERVWGKCARCAGVAGALVLFIFSPAIPALAQGVSTHNQIRITLLSLGAGQTAIIQTDGDHATLIDAGSSSVADVMRSILTPYLRQAECRHIDRIFLSHGDFDHISSAADIFQTYEEPEIFMSPHFARHAVGTLPAEGLLKALEVAERPAHLIHEGDHVELGNSASIDVLWPPVDCNNNSNDCGLVLQLHYAGKSVLFPADIQVAPEAALMRHPGLLKSDILIAPHHGSAETTTGGFIKAVDPRMILASNSIKLTHKQKVFDELARSYPVYRTSRCGTITVTIEDDGRITVETFTGAAPVESVHAN